MSDFFVRVAIAVAWVEHQMWSQYEFGDPVLEQRWIRESWDVIEWAAGHCPHLLPTIDIHGQSVIPEWQWS